ncbi:hypothetical protein AAVH_33597 [Aphelenchoides avenae]|nr:hypothetical protein AAVH_33597 [Aphelenchus avenae]
MLIDWLDVLLSTVVGASIDILKKRRQKSGPISTRFYVETFVLFAVAALMIDAALGKLFPSHVANEMEKSYTHRILHCLGTIAVARLCGRLVTTLSGSDPNVPTHDRVAEMLSPDRQHNE